MMINNHPHNAIPFLEEQYPFVQNCVLLLCQVASKPRITQALVVVLQFFRFQLQPIERKKSAQILAYELMICLSWPVVLCVISNIVDVASYPDIKFVLGDAVVCGQLQTSKDGERFYGDVFVVNLELVFCLFCHSEVMWWRCSAIVVCREAILDLGDAYKNLNGRRNNLGGISKYYLSGMNIQHFSLSSSFSAHFRRFHHLCRQLHVTSILYP